MDITPIDHLINDKDISFSDEYALSTYSLRFVVRTLAIAYSEITKQQRDQLTEKLEAIFIQWRNDHGEVSVGGEKPIPYKEYLLSHDHEDDKELFPWECAGDITFPFELLLKLFVDEYPPLIEYIDQESTPRLDYIFISATLMSLKNGLGKYSKEFLEYSLRIIDIRLNIQNILIEGAIPYVEKELKRKASFDSSNKLRREENKMRVGELYIEMKKRDRPPSNIQEKIAEQLSVSQSYVSKLLKELKTENLLIEHFE